MYTLEDIQAVDMEVAQAITDELDRQNSHIELIASENWVSPADITVAASAWTLWKNWQESAQKNYLGVSMSMCSHIPVRRQIWRYSLQF